MFFGSLMLGILLISLELTKSEGALRSGLTLCGDIPEAPIAKRAIRNGPDGKLVHAELTVRGTTVMLGPENEAMGKRSAKSVGASPAELYIYVENVDKVVEKATNLGVLGALNRVRRGEAKTVSEAASYASAEDPSFLFTRAA